RPRAARLDLEQVDAGGAARRAQHERALPRRRTALLDLAAAHAADVPAVGAAARVDVERHALAGAHRDHRRLRRELPDGDARLAADLAGDRREHSGRGAEVAGLVADADHDHVDPGRRGQAVDLAVPLRGLAALAAQEARDLLRRAEVGAEHAEARRAAAPDAPGVDL